MTNVERAARAARARLEHASRRARELAAAIEAWTSTDPIGITSVIANDRLSWEGRWRVTEPPYEQWALTFADAAHHLRAVLDNLVYFIAEQEGATPQQLGSVQFPIVRHPEKWSESRKRIAMLPKRVRSVIEAIQPFQRPEPERASDALAILAGLNNADKHRIILVSLIQPQTIGHSISVEFSDDPTEDVPPRTELLLEMVDGRPAIRHDTSPNRIAKVIGVGQFAAQVVILDDAGNRWGITSSLAAVSAYVPTVLDVILASWSEGTSTG